MNRNFVAVQMQLYHMYFQVEMVKIVKVMFVPSHAVHFPNAFIILPHHKDASFILQNDRFPLLCELLLNGSINDFLKNFCIYSVGM